MAARLIFRQKIFAKKNLNDLIAAEIFLFCSRKIFISESIFRKVLCIRVRILSKNSHYSWRLK